MKIRNLFISAILSTAFFARAGEIVRVQLEPEKEYQFLMLAKLPNDFNRLPQEDATVKFKRDAKNLYISVDMLDADTVSESVSDQTNLTKFGDSLQIFIKPEKDSRLWELMTDVKNRKSCFFHWGTGRMIYYPAPSAPAPVKISAKSEKTTAGWKSEIVFPLAEAAKANNIPADAVWNIMVVRHNCGSNLNIKDTASFPQAVGKENNPARFARLFPAGK